MLLDSFCNRIAADFKQKELLPLKMLFFVHASTLYVLYPYLTIHMRELGISVEETAIMSAVTPVVAIVMPPVAGIIADRIGNFKLMLALFSSLGGAAALLLLAVPVGRYTQHFPQTVSLSMSCSGRSLEMNWADPHPCQAIALSPDVLNASLVDCGVQCLDNRQSSPGSRQELNRSLSAAPRYTLRLSDADSRSTDSYTYTQDLASGLLPRLLPVPESSQTPAEVYFPFPGLHNFGCFYNNTQLVCSMGKESSDHNNELHLHSSTSRQTFRVSLSDLSGEATENKKFLIREMAGHLTGDQQPTPVTCRDDLRKDNRVSSVDFIGNIPHAMERCVATCLVNLPRSSFCSKSFRVVEVDPSFTFWMYLVIRVFVGMIGGTAFAMFEGAVIAILREHDADYGLQRIYASIGGMISSPLSGVLIDYASSGKGYTDFRPAFYLYAALKLAGGLLMLTINLEFKAPAQNVISDVLQVLRNVEMVFLIVVCFLLGTAWGYIENFLFWLLQDLGASRSLMGITITVGGVAGIPLLVFSGPIISKIGHANVLFIGFIFYAIRLLGYSLIYNPWLCLIFESMESFTSSLATTAAVTYAATLSTTSTDTSVQGLIGGVYYGVGKGSGSLIGGYLMTFVGTRNTYRIFAVGSLAAGIIYYLSNRFYLQPHRRKGKDTQDPEKPVSEKDKEACQMTDLSKVKEMNTTGLNNKQQVENNVQIKNNKNTQFMQGSVEKVPLNLNSATPRDYSTSGDVESSRRCSSNSLSPPLNIRRRKSSDCSQTSGVESPNSRRPSGVSVNLACDQDKETKSGDD